MKNNAWRERGSWLGSVRALDLGSCTALGSRLARALRSWLRSTSTPDLRSISTQASRSKPKLAPRSKRQASALDLRSWLRSPSTQDLRSCSAKPRRVRSASCQRSARGGFTLIEVLVSVMIIALVGTALLELSTKSVRIVSFLKQKEELPFMVAFAANHYGADDENLDKNFLDGVEKFYRLDSARLKGFLNKNAVYSKDLAERIYFDDNSSALGQIEIHKHTIKTKTAVAYLYRIEIPRADLNITK